MPLKPHGRNDAAAGIRASVSHVSIHSAEPDNQGSHEVGQSRAAISLTAPVNGEMSPASAVEVLVPPGVSVSWIGYWDASSGGRLLATENIPFESFPNGGKVLITEQTVLRIQ